MKLDPTVKKETLYIASWTVILALLMHAVFLLLGKWTLPVLFGSLLSVSAGILNFLLLGVSVQKAVAMADAKEAKTSLRLSWLLRTLFLFGVAVLGAVLPVFDIWATVIPLFFPRIAMLLRPLFPKNAPTSASEDGGKEADGDQNA